MYSRFTLLCLLAISLNVFAQQDDSDQWRTPSLDSQVYMQTEAGLVIIEIAPFMAPNNAKQFTDLVSSGFYDGLSFYRVIDGFVAQAGSMSEQLPKGFTTLGAEFSRVAPKDSQFTLVQSPAFLAPQTGYLNGFSAGRDPQSKQEWLLHCPGAVAMARRTDKDSASTEFYIVIGQAPRHLDRNMSVFGRVIYGLDAAQKLQRADPNNPSGVIEDEAKRSKIKWAKIASQVPEKQRIHVQVQRQSSQAAMQRIENAKTKPSDFYVHKGEGKLDLCYYQLKTRTAP